MKRQLTVCAAILVIIIMVGFFGCGGTGGSTGAGDKGQSTSAGVSTGGATGGTSTSTGESTGTTPGTPAAVWTGRYEGYIQFEIKGETYRITDIRNYKYPENSNRYFINFIGGENSNPSIQISLLDSGIGEYNSANTIPCGCAITLADNHVYGRTEFHIIINSYRAWQANSVVEDTGIHDAWDVTGIFDGLMKDNTTGETNIPLTNGLFDIHYVENQVSP